MASGSSDTRGKPPVLEPAGDTSTDQAAVWTYRGYKLRPGEFTTSMVHLYRAEVTRANTWRRRLDSTTNWAVVAGGAAVTVAFSQPTTHHSVILLNALLITVFLYIEARRYRYYELFSSRIRFMETDFFASMLVPPFRPDAEWAPRLAESLLNPQFPISLWEAVGRRLRRNYAWLYAVELIAWLAKLALDRPGIPSLEDYVSRASLGPVPGEVVMAVALAFNIALLAIAVFTYRLQEATGEVLPRYAAGTRWRAGRRGYQTPQEAETAPPRQTQSSRYLAVVSTEQIEPVQARLKKAFPQGVTALSPGNTSGPKTTLVVPVALTEIQQVRTIVLSVDPRGVVVAIPLEEILSSHVLSNLAAESPKGEE